VKTYLRSHRTDHESIDKQGILLNIACDVASGLQAMHLSNFVHRFAAIVSANIDKVCVRDVWTAYSSTSRAEFALILTVHRQLCSLL